MADKLICQNRKAGFNYHLEETHEAGIALTGTEVKSLRAGHANLADGYVQPRGRELFLINVHISPYDQGNIANHDPLRPRKLLMHREEIQRLLGKVRERGYTLIPVRMYFKDGRAKVAVALAKGKKKFDKRESIKRKEQDRELARALKVRR